MATESVRLLSAGAARGLVEALAGKRDGGPALECEFDAVGAIRQRLLAGSACDVLILTEPLIAELVAAAQVVGASVVPLGWVRTGVAVRATDALPRVADAVQLAQAIGGATRFHVPDTRLSTAGIHLARVLERLGLPGDLDGRLAEHPNGAAAMLALAADRSASPLGATQVTEILCTPGVALVSGLPPGFESRARYCAAVVTRSERPADARRLIDLLAGPASLRQRVAAGFEA